MAAGPDIPVLFVADGDPDACRVTESAQRVAGAVGEGSVAVGSVHQYLAGPAGT